MINRGEAVGTEKPVKEKYGGDGGGINMVVTVVMGRWWGPGIAFAHLPHQYTSLSTYESIMWTSSEGVPAQEAKLIRCKALMLVLLQNELSLQCEPVHSCSVIIAGRTGPKIFGTR